MKLKMLTLSTSLMVAFLGLSNVSYASNAAELLADENMVLEVFSHLTARDVVNFATVSKAFYKAACNPRSSFSKEMNSPEAKKFREFCYTGGQVDVATILKYAQEIKAMKTNPLPTLVNPHDFEHAQDIAQQYINNYGPVNGTPSYIQ